MKELLDFADKSDDLAFYEEVILAMLSVYEDMADKDSIRKIMEQYENAYKPSDTFLYIKARFLSDVLNEYKEALALMKENESKSYRWKTLLLHYYCDIRDRDNAEKILNKYFKNDLKRQLTYHSSFNDDEEVVKIVDKFAEKYQLDITFISAKSCSLIRLKKYEDAYKFAKKYFDNPYMQREGVICINYYLALEKYNKPNDFNSKIKRKMIDRLISYSAAEMAAAYALLNDKAKCFSYLRKVIAKNELMKFDVKEWPVFEKYLNDRDFKQITDTSNFKL